MSTSNPSADGQSEVGQVFEQFQSYIDTRLSNLENSLQSANHDQPETNDIQASTKKLQREADALKFKYKPNAKQFIYNAKVEDLVGSTVEHLEKENPSCEQAFGIDTEAPAKMTKLADKSDAGWLVVEEYESDELAEDSEDGKKIRNIEYKRKIRFSFVFMFRYEVELNFTCFVSLFMFRCARRSLELRMQGWILIQTKECPLRMAIITSPRSQVGNNNVPVQTRVESEKSDLSEDEMCVLQVQSYGKGEFVCTGINGRSQLPTQTCQVRGRLKQHIQFWEAIEAPKFILNTIREGYKIAFLVEPAYSFKSNNRSAKLHDDFVSDTINELLEGDRISEVQCRQDLHVVSPLSVSVQPSGKKRLILDFRLVNKCLLQEEVYLDDGLGIEETVEKVEYAAHHIRGDLFAAGFIVAEEKSVWDPTQIIEWLGIKWNSKSGNISIADKRITKAAALLRNASEFPTKSARELAKIVGSIISMGPVLGRLTSIMTRHCQMTVAAGQDWDTKYALDNYCLSEINFWLQNLQFVNSKYCFNRIAHNKMVYSDASAYACGALVQGENQMVCYKMFTPEEISCSSTHRELITILYSLEAFGEKLFNSRIKWFTDNQSTAKIVDVGSMKLTLHALAYKIFSYCLANNIDLSIQWIPRELNAQADFISKIKDCDDWQITSDFFF
ncbi:Hypothetical predicted protein [Paramuricea clavata]|uniref:Reverse transcriptase RNase H-like domain-containing protein n=1 Tax=Paramuricea clavata TaxID=317549 RepID=A0A6S7JBY0_PARCT|nr:Hypothetical predicted protein [Paramuricea clavata]